jgi:hypothetical protein
MLARLTNFESQISLIEGTGIQFLDFGFGKNIKLLSEGNFLDGELAKPFGKVSVPILLQVDRQGILKMPGINGSQFSGIPKHFYSGLDSLTSFVDQWLPLPFFQKRLDDSYVLGPENWVRFRLFKLETPDEDGNLFRLTLAVDTTIPNRQFEQSYLAPLKEDIEGGKVFGLVTSQEIQHSFITIDWVSKWIERTWSNNLKNNKGQPLSPFQIAEIKEDWPLIATAKYLHILAILEKEVDLPNLKLLKNSNDQSRPVVDSTLILDIGNSRTCAVVLEKHPDQQSNLRTSYTLELRDLGHSHLVYSEPFESRVEFTQADFGSDALSRESGRLNAFMWPTFTRVGPEASRLASRRRGTEGATGLASPKRYLWDEAPFPLNWHFNQPNSLVVEPLANEGVLLSLINESGDALCELEQDDPNRFPVLNPRYSRSSLMTFAISEILAQTLCQINSPSKRLRMPNYDLARRLKRLVLTLPPAMPIQEQAILKKRTQHACKLVWQSLGYLDSEGNISASDVPAIPEIIIRYDEATCAQVVWLYSMVTSQFGGSAPSMFQATQRHFGDVNVRPSNVLRVASIDIGGGTTDLVIADYTLEGTGNNVTILPEQIFREGFSIAGDDILKRVIQIHVMTSIEEGLQICGLSDPTVVTKELFGADRANQDIQLKTLRRQATTQILAPLGLKLLSSYENLEKVATLEPIRCTVEDCLPHKISANVISFINDFALQAGAINFDILQCFISIDLRAIHKTIEHGTEINRVLEALCELVHAHNCDVLLLTGRPTRLAGIVSTVKRLLPLPIEKIIEMNGFRSGSWYPFHHFGCIGDPKTTAAVGAMLCTISEGGLPNFLFRSDKLNLRSTTRFIGKLTNDGQIPKADVFYSDVRLDDIDYELPDASFEFRGAMLLGFRQLPLERWRASLIYVLDYADEESRKRLHPKTPLRVVLRRDAGGIRKGETEKFEISEVLGNDGTQLNRRFLSLKLQTLPDDSGYWLDSGHLKEA